MIWLTYNLKVPIPRTFVLHFLRLAPSRPCCVLHFSIKRSMEYSKPRKQKKNLVKVSYNQERQESSSQIYIFPSSPPTQSLSTYNDDVLSYDPSGLRSYLIGKLTVCQRTGWREPVQKKPSNKSKQKQQKHYLCSLLLRTGIKKKSEMHFSMNCEIPVMIRNNKGKLNLFGAYHPCTRPSRLI